MNAPTNGFNIPGFKTLNANGHLIHYAAHGAGWRYDTLLQKEPETIEWIDTFAPGETLWDIGANVGIYSIYAGVKGIRTHAFEPHFANYQQFCITIAANGLQDVVTPLCLAFSDRKSVSELNLASLEVGTSMSNFGAALDFRGQPFQPAFRQGMIGYDIDSFVEDFGAEIPDHIKIDVDGIELPIVEGAAKTLANPKVKSVSIELIETDSAQVDAVTALMERAGLKFVHKKQNLAFSTADTTDVLNFLFHRDPDAFRAALKDREREHQASASKLPEREDGSFTTDELVSRIAGRIRGAEIDGVPSANIFMEGMLPQNVYRELLARLPGDSALDPIDHPDARTINGRRTRQLLDLTPASLARVKGEDRPFWEAMIAVFTAPEIAEAMLAKFEPELRARFGDAMPELVAVPILYRDFPGYRIGIHPDTPKKIATLQFYLPEDESQIHLGTSFHCRASGGFVRHKTNSFLPNSAYAFVRTDESWHSVDELGPDEKVRNTIALTFYIKGQEYSSEPKAAKTAERNGVYSGVYDAEMQDALRNLAPRLATASDLATLFRVDGTGVSLGVGSGTLSEEILSRSKIAHLYCIDSWSGEGGPQIDDYRGAIRTLNAHRDRSSILRMQGDEALDLFGDGSLDFVYANALPGDAEQDRRTLASWFVKLRPAGILAGSGAAGSVAVTDFAAEQRLEIHPIGQSGGWFAMKP